jgi:hypothetical protein
MKKIFMISFIVFVIVNIVENVIHYSIGRTYNQRNKQIQAPTNTDWIRIMGVMLVCATIHASLTSFLSRLF